jgi:hypothetical protein
MRIVKLLALDILVVALVLLLVGCGSVYRPKSPIPAATFSNPFLADLASGTLLSAYDAMPEGPAKVARRNAILFEIIYLTDQTYGKYEESFFSGQAFLATGADTLNLGLAGVASVTGTAHLKAVLAAISGGVTGIRSSYQKNFYDQATRETIVQVMRAARLARLAEIEAGMATCSTSVPCGAPGTSYSLEQGLLDVTAYYDDGTVMGALISISHSSSQQAVTARAAIRAMHGAKP